MTLRKEGWLTVRVVLVLLTAAFVITGVVTLSQTPLAPGALKTRQIEYGRQLVALGGCNDCHTPVKSDPRTGLPVPQLDRALSGHPHDAPSPASTLSGSDQVVLGPTMTSFKIPSGTVYAANLTPDRETGLGTWNETLFIDTVRSGRHLGAGRPILPPMPWPSLRQQSDADLRAMFAYLQSLPAIHNPVPAPQVSAETLDRLGRSYDVLAASIPKGPSDEASPHQIWHAQ
ncbi:MAG TPA: hypothetical protein VJV78_17880 [Polyangiales bacterium]|nr:hypothetical protein [Polyangiales bacterium]